jgi:hypothetical protein
MRDLKVLHTIRELPTNNDGLCALSPNNDNPYLAYPGSSITGEIQIFDTNNLVRREFYVHFKRLLIVLYRNKELQSMLMMVHWLQCPLI